MSGKVRNLSPETEARIRTISVPEAGRALGLGRNGSYAAAERGDMPSIRIGRRLRVPLVALEKLLADAGVKR